MQNQNQTYVQRDPNDFKPGKFHPALKLIPELAQDSEEFLALAAAVKKCGFIRPLLVDTEGRLVDDHSRSLWRVALRWQLTAVPCLVTPEPMLALIHSLKDVRHMTKSAIAYLLLPVVENQVKAALAQHRENLSKGQYKTFSASGGEGLVPSAPTLPKLCEELGFSEDMLDRARKVHDEFLSKTVYTFDVVGGPQDGSVKQCTLKEYFEPRILQTPVGGEHEQNRPMGLGAVMAAIAGIRATKDKGRPEKNLSRLFKKILGGSENQLEFWQESQSAAVAEIERRAAQLEPKTCEQLAAMHAQMAKIYRDHSKASA